MTTRKQRSKKPALPAGTAGAREAWLETGYRDDLAPLLIAAAAKAGLPYRAAPPVRVTCGWPSKGAMPGGKKTRIGECWSPKAAADKVAQISISPLIEKPVEALDILLHENIHAFVGVECGHKGPFAAVARAVGLEGKLTATVAGPELRKKLEAIAKKLGDYPHVKLNPGLSGIKHQKNRHALATCPECDYKIRLSRKVAEEKGLPVCPCGATFKMEGADEEQEQDDGAGEEAGNRRPAPKAKPAPEPEPKLTEVKVDGKTIPVRGPCTWENRFGIAVGYHRESGPALPPPHGFRVAPLVPLMTPVPERPKVALATLLRHPAWKGAIVTDRGDHVEVRKGTAVAKLLK